MRSIIKYIKPFYIIVAFFIVFFRKSFFKELIPIPFNLLVQWYFPYNHGGWQSSGIFTHFKGGQFASDAIRQIYPWKELAFEMIKKQTLPLWNPYSFSGTPLLANMQTAIFYPLNIIFLFISSFPWAWALYIALPILLSGLFMYKFLTSLKLEKFSAVFGALAFSSSGYMVSWLEWGVIPHAMMWLPLSLYSIKLWFQTLNRKYLLLLVFSATSTILAGYPQGSAYSMIIVASYFFFLIVKTASKKRKTTSLSIIISGLLVIGITAIQWIPTMELFFQSAMKGKVSQNLSRETAMPLPHFATLLAPDYFGNRVTENYWAKSFSGLDYMDADLFVGVVLLPLVLFAVLAKKKRKETKWLIWVLIIGIALGSKSPVSALISQLGVPVLGTGAAAEALIMLIFSASCLGAFGLNQLTNKFSKKKLFFSYAIITSLYLLLITATFFISKEFALVSRRNLVIPLAAFISSLVVVFLSLKIKLFAKYTKYIFILILAVELLLHANKILPFSSPKYAFPNHILIKKLQTISAYDRVAGFWETEIATNFHTAFRLYSAEGYDPLYIRRYGEFITSADKGELAKDIPRSDADITMDNEANRNRLLDLTSIKYIPAKVTNPEENWEWEEEPLKYNPERFKLVWQERGFKIYENLKALPRVKLFFDWQVISNDEEIIHTLYDPEFDFQNKIILENNPNIEKSDENNGTTNILEYGSSKVIVKTDSPKPSILLLTDSFYKGWQATIDEIPTEILRANYNFKAVVVPKGKHIINLKYKPKSLVIGAIISFSSIVLIFIFFKILPHKKNTVKE